MLGESTYEVLSETELPEDGVVVYRLRPWPEGEVVRDRVVYGRAFVRAAEAERERARVRERARPWRLLLYPLVGLLPEEEQERVCDRLGLYAVTATLVSGLARSRPGPAGARAARSRATRAVRSSLVSTAAGLVLLVLPGLGRAFGAAFLRETGGSAPVVLALEALRALGRAPGAPRPQLRPAHAVRLLGTARPAGHAWRRRGDGTLVFRGLLPHLTWSGGRRLSVGRDYWSVTPEAPALRSRPARLLVSPRAARRAGREARPPPRRRLRRRGARGRAAGVGRLQRGLRLAHVPAPRRRAGARVRPPGRARRPRARPTLATAAGGGLLGLYLLSFLPGGPAADPLAPVLGGTAVLLLVDAVRRSGRRAAAATRRASSVGCCPRTRCGPSASPITPTARRSGRRLANWSDRLLQLFEADP